jgi:ribonucleotide reductase alpha subunit
LNNVIDINYYPTIETSKSNLSTRPIGIGIQGLGNLLLELRLPYESNEALEIEYRVMETIYYGAMLETIDLSRKYGSYARFVESPFFHGKFQFDLWDDKKTKMWDWDSLRFNMVFNGTRNSMLTALMPTASTSQILGNMECFEPITSNIYIRKTSVGTFKLVNKHLIKDLEKLGLWNEEMKNNIILNNGSVQKILNIPEELKLLYKTVWEIKQKWVIDHALARAPFVDQSQSMNLYFEKIDINKVRSALFYGWKKGIKTGSYYMRTQSASNAGNNILNEIKNINREITECLTCSA